MARLAAGAFDPRMMRWLLGAAGGLMTLAIWSLLSHLLAGGGGVINRLPGPAPVARDLLRYALDGLGQDLVSSLEVFLIGWLIGGICAIGLGLVLGRVRMLGSIFLPVVEAIRPVSSIAWVPLCIVWFGFSLVSKVFLVGLAVFLVVIVYAVDGSARIPADLSQTAAMLGMTGWRRFRSLVLPATLSEVLVGARVALMAGWGTVIVAELVAANSGLGAHLIDVEQSYNVAAVVATMICFGVVGLLMNAAFTFAEARALPWHPDRDAAT